MKLLWMMTLIVLSACSEATLQVQTEPSEVDVVQVVNGVEHKIGVTPFNLSKDKYKEGENLRLQFYKPGFLKEQIVLSSTYFRKVGSVNLKLTPRANWKEASQDPQANKYLNDVASMSAEIQALTVKKDFSQAESLVRSLVTRYPKLSVGWNLMGNIYYLQRRVGDAIQAYTKALDLNPDDEEARKILTKLKGISI